MKRNDTEMIKAVLLDCEILKNYCKQNNLSIDKLQNLNVAILPRMYAFTRPSDFKLPEEAIGLEYDIETQPVALLGIDILEDGELKIVPTEHTKELAL